MISTGKLSNNVYVEAILSLILLSLILLSLILLSLNFLSPILLSPILPILLSPILPILLSHQILLLVLNSQNNRQLQSPHTATSKQVSTGTHFEEDNSVDTQEAQSSTLLLVGPNSGKLLSSIEERLIGQSQSGSIFKRCEYLENVHVLTSSTTLSISKSHSQY